jgi:6-pyruvoyltetrahydropterin/6-carboxytetrahydropterin synthase|tara:strand:- start:1744 stop:2166 length:423 start_codon:yes stop_codon:yes gene_type:complete
MITATRYHDFSAGHKVTGHENKCSHLHGHNYRIYFTIRSDVGVDDLGRVLDFSAIKSYLCEWLESEWDHRFLIYTSDPDVAVLQRYFPDDVVVTPFNPTAENMARYLVETVAPRELKQTGCELVSCTVQETRKCQATFSR